MTHLIRFVKDETMPVYLSILLLTHASPHTRYRLKLRIVIVYDNHRLITVAFSKTPHYFLVYNPYFNDRTAIPVLMDQSTEWLSKLHVLF